MTTTIVIGGRKKSVVRGGTTTPTDLSMAIHGGELKMRMSIESSVVVNTRKAHVSAIKTSSSRMTRSEREGTSIESQERDEVSQLCHLCSDLVQMLLPQKIKRTTMRKGIADAAIGITTKKFILEEEVRTLRTANTIGTTDAGAIKPSLNPTAIINSMLATIRTTTICITSSNSSNTWRHCEGLIRRLITTIMPCNKPSSRASSRRHQQLTTSDACQCDQATAPATRKRGEARGLLHQSLHAFL